MADPIPPQRPPLPEHAGVAPSSPKLPTPGSPPAAERPSLKGRAAEQLQVAAETPAQQLAAKLRSEDSSHWKVSNGELLYYKGKKPFFGRGTPTSTSSVAAVKAALGEDLKIAKEEDLRLLVVAVSQFNALVDPKDQIHPLDYLRGGITLETFCLWLQCDPSSSHWKFSDLGVEYRAKPDDQRPMYCFSVAEVARGMTERGQKMRGEADAESLRLLELAKSPQPWNSEWEASMRCCQKRYHEVERYVERFNQLSLAYERSGGNWRSHLACLPGPTPAHARQFERAKAARGRLELSEAGLNRCFCFSEQGVLRIGVHLIGDEGFTTYSYSVADLIKTLQVALFQEGKEEDLQKAELLLAFLKRQPSSDPNHRALLHGTIDALEQIIRNTRDAKK